MKCTKLLKTIEEEEVEKAGGEGSCQRHHSSSINKPHPTDVSPCLQHSLWCQNPGEDGRPEPTMDRLRRQCDTIRSAATRVIAAATETLQETEPMHTDL